MRTKTTERPCPVCQSCGAAVLHHQDFLLAEGHPLSAGYDVVACQACGFVFADTPSSQEYYDKLYADWSKYGDAKAATGGGESRWDKARLDENATTLARHLARSSSILDVGCATGGLLDSLRACGFTRLSGLDPSPQCVRAVREKGIAASVGVLTALPDGIGQYDCVIVNHVLEHVRDLREAMQGLRRLLHPASILYAEVPDAERYTDYCYAPFQDFNTEHINHFSRTTLGNLFAAQSFEMMAGNAKLIRLSESMYYPAVYGLFRPCGPTPPVLKDNRLSERILSYIATSSRMMGEIRQRVDGWVKTFPSFVVWGTGELTHKLLRYTALKDANITAFVDSNPVHHGKLLHGVRIRAPRAIQGTDCPIVISTMLHHSEITDQIRSLGLNNRILVLEGE